MQFYLLTNRMDNRIAAIVRASNDIKARGLVYDYTLDQSWLNEGEVSARHLLADAYGEGVIMIKE